MAEKWFKELNQFAENEPKVILVGNKIDLPNPKITTDEARELAKKYSGVFLEVSALTGLNVDEIFNTLTCEIYYKKIKAAKNKANKKKQIKINDGDSTSEVVRKEGCCS